MPGGLLQYATVDQAYQLVVVCGWRGLVHGVARCLLFDCGQVLGDFRQHFGPAYSPALQIINAQFSQLDHDLIVLYLFGDGLLAEKVGQVIDGARDRVIVAVLVDIGDKTAVYLYVINR